MNRLYFGVFLALIGSMLLQSCMKDQCTQTRLFTEIIPVYLPADEIRVAPRWEANRELDNTGKLYVYQDYLLINERNQGIHVYNNADPANPISLGFISIPGNVDMAIRDGILYADNYMDLLAIDISDVSSPRVTCRQENVFTQFWYDENREAYLVEYSETDRTRTLECTDPNFGSGFFNDRGIVFVENAPDIVNDSGRGSTGVGGSFARFTIAQDHLYAVDQSNIYTFDLEEKQKPRQTDMQYIAWGIETIFPYQGKLFIGANDGMYIYSATTPGAPKYASTFTHARACDPVFVQGDIAYVTLRNGSRCESFTNQLDIVDVSNIRRPELIISHDMDNPHGLSVRDDHLFICEGVRGIKNFDKSDFNDLDLLDHEKDVHAYDVISLATDHLLVVGDDGLYQYSVSERGKLSELSKLITKS